MRKIIILFIMVLMLAPFSSYASIYGILKGRVVDKDGKPVVGASVIVKGTTRGAAVRDKNGTFSIVNIIAGEYDIIVKMVGYEETTTKVRISADQTSEIDITLNEKGVTTKTLTIIGEKLVDKTSIGTTKKISGEEVTYTAREGVQGIVALSAGVASSGSGFNIRGSRSSETQIRYNNLDIANQFTGGLGGMSNDYFPMVSAFATEEIQVLTGGFSAEYGEALGGVVNTVPKTGRNDRYEGFMRFRTDIDALWGSQGNGLRIVSEDNKKKIINTSEGGLGTQGPGQLNFEGGFGGPIPGLDKSTFFISALNKYEKYSGGGSYKMYDPDGTNIGRLDNDQIWVRNIVPNFRFQLTNDISIIVGGLYGLTSMEYASLGWSYATSEGVLFDENGAIIPGSSNGISEYKAKMPVRNDFVYNAMARINHTLTSTSFYEFTVSFNGSSQEIGRRANYNDPSFYSGFDIMKPQDNYSVLGDRMIPGHDFILDQYTYLSKNQKSKDGYAEFDIPIPNPLTGYIEGQASNVVTNNPWGIFGFSYMHGNTNGVEFRKGSFLQFDGSYTNNIDDGDFDHIIKSGFEIRLYTMDRHYNGNPWDGLPFHDIYSDRWGGNIYADSVNVYNKTSSPVHAKRFSGYVQDQISYKGIIFSPGLRFDLFDPSSEYRFAENKYFVSVGADSGFGNSTVKFQISPRINIAYPITERSNIAISYGLYFKMPELQYMYDNYSIDRIRGGAVIVGNPNMEAQRTNQYQVQYVNSLTDNFRFDITAYYKDIYNQIGVNYVPAVPDPYYLFTVSEYGNAKGLEFTFRKTRSDNFSFEVNYTLSQVVGTASSAGDNYNPGTDPYTGNVMFPLAEFNLSYDVRHRINPIIDFFWGDDEGPSIGDIHFLENANINLSGVYRTGYPYTRMDKNQKPLSEINAERLPSVWQIDMRVTKEFKLKDWFGESMANSSLEFYVDVNNLLNRTEATRYFTFTGNPDDDGVSLERELGTFVMTPHYKEANYGNAESFRTAQYDIYGNRFYNAKADYDNNGVVTREERYISYFRYLELAVSGRQNYQFPRTVFFGMIVRF